MRKILVPTDFSDFAAIAEEYAFEIAKIAHSEIHFLHILITPVEWVKLPLEKEKLYPDIKLQIDHARVELRKLQNKGEKMGLKIQELLVFDIGREEIDSYIKNHNYDLIVMGSHGVKGLKEIIGSNTQRVVRYSKIPVLTVKKKNEEVKIEKIIFASNFNEDLRQPFQKIIDFAKLVKAQIYLLYVNTPYNFKETSEVEELMRSLIKECFYEFCTVHIYNALNEERGINMFAKSINADLIALTTHGKTGIIKLISPSITEDLVNHSEIPILSLRYI